MAFTLVDSKVEVLSKVKSGISPRDMGNVSYKATCQDRDMVYVSNTSRALTERFREHEYFLEKAPKSMVELENLDTNPATALHSNEHSHTKYVN